MTELLTFSLLLHHLEGNLFLDRSLGAAPRATGDSDAGSSPPQVALESGHCSLETLHPWPVQDQFSFQPEGLGFGPTSSSQT